MENRIGMVWELTSSPGLFLGWAVGHRLAIRNGRGALVSRSHRQGLVMLTTREVQRLPLMARIFLSSCLCLTGTGHITTAATYSRPLVAVALLSSIDMRVSWLERGVGLSLVT